MNELYSNGPRVAPHGLAVVIDAHLRDAERSGFKSLPGIGALATNIGKRRRNEDRMAVAHFWFRGAPALLACVADGIGGLQNGAECASEVTAAFIAATYVALHQGVDDAVTLCRRGADYANNSAHESFRGKSGSTIVALVLLEGSGAYMWAGDSKIIGLTTDSLESLSTDDTMIARFSTIENLDESLKRSRGLLQYVGMGNDFVPHIESLKPGRFKRIMLASDGIAILDGSYIQSLAAGDDATSAVRHLVTASSWSKDADNSSIILLDTSPLSAPRDQSHLAIYTIDGVIAIPNSRFVIPKTTAPPEKQRKRKASKSGSGRREDVVKVTQPPPSMLEITD